MWIPRGRPDFGLEEFEVVAHCLSSGAAATGPQIETFEKEVARFLGKRLAIATSNGWSAIFLTLKALGNVAQDEVIIPTTVCRSVYDAVYMAGFCPVLVDCNRHDFNLSVEAVKDHITPQVRAIIVPHLRGIPSDMDELLDLGIPIIEDVAQSLGAKYRGQQTGTFGLAAVCSFYPTKIISSIDGGMVVTDDEELAKNVRRLRYHRDLGADTAYNFKMNNVNAAVGLCQLEKLNSFIQERMRQFHEYRTYLRDLGLHRYVDRCKEVVYDKFLLEVSNVDKYKRALEEEGIQPIVATHLLHEELGRVGDYHNAEALANRIIALPMYPRLQNHHLLHIVEVVKEAAKTL